jgi:hypothetical protein
MQLENYEALQGYFKTENEHWNNWMFEYMAEVIEKGLFENIEPAMRMFNYSLDTAIECHDEPLKALHLIQDQFDEEGLNNEQRVFVFELLLKYIRNSHFEEIEISDFKVLTNSVIKNLQYTIVRKNEVNNELVSDLREQLKAMLQSEIQKIPENLLAMQPAQRLAVICKLMPYVLPRVDILH